MNSHNSEREKKKHIKRIRVTRWPNPCPNGKWGGN